MRFAGHKWKVEISHRKKSHFRYVGEGVGGSVKGQTFHDPHCVNYINTPSLHSPHCERHTELLHTALYHQGRICFVLEFVPKASTR